MAPNPYESPRESQVQEDRRKPRFLGALLVLLALLVLASIFMIGQLRSLKGKQTAPAKAPIRDNRSTNLAPRQRHFITHDPTFRVNTNALPPPHAADQLTMEINWSIVASNIADAREELESIEALVAAGTPPGDVEFQVAMQHAFHHLNFAWNVRHQSLDRYANLTKEEFDRWGRFPSDLDFGD